MAAPSPSGQSGPRWLGAGPRDKDGWVQTSVKGTSQTQRHLLGADETGDSGVLEGRRALTLDVSRKEQVSGQDVGPIVLMCICAVPWAEAGSQHLLCLPWGEKVPAPRGWAGKELAESCKYS